MGLAEGNGSRALDLISRALDAIHGPSKANKRCGNTDIKDAEAGKAKGFGNSRVRGGDTFECGWQKVKTGAQICSVSGL